MRQISQILEDINPVKGLVQRSSYLLTCQFQATCGEASSGLSVPESCSCALLVASAWGRLNSLSTHRLDTIGAHGHLISPSRQVSATLSVPIYTDKLLNALTCISMAAVRPASRTSSWFALPSCSIESSSFTSLAWRRWSSPRGTGERTALLVTKLNASTLMPQCLATIISGTVDMPTRSAPTWRSIRHSARVS